MFTATANQYLTGPSVLVPSGSTGFSNGHRTTPHFSSRIRYWPMRRPGQHGLKRQQIGQYGYRSRHAPEAWEREHRKIWYLIISKIKIISVKAGVFSFLLKESRVVYSPSSRKTREPRHEEADARPRARGDD
jgi:hypothetical protein